MRIGGLCARATLPFLFIHLILLLFVAIRLNVPLLVTVVAHEPGLNTSAPLSNLHPYP